MVGSEVSNFFARALLIFPPMPYFLNARNRQFYPRGATPPLPGDKTPVPSDPGVVLAEKLGRGVRPASQNPYPIYDQNLRFSLPYL